MLSTASNRPSMYVEPSHLPNIAPIISVLRSEGRLHLWTLNVNDTRHVLCKAKFVSLFPIKRTPSSCRHYSGCKKQICRKGLFCSECSKDLWREVGSYSASNEVISDDGHIKFSKIKGGVYSKRDKFKGIGTEPRKILELAISTKHNCWLWGSIDTSSKDLQ